MASPARFGHVGTVHVNPSSNRKVVALGVSDGGSDRVDSSARFNYPARERAALHFAKGRCWSARPTSPVAVFETRQHLGTPYSPREAMVKSAALLWDPFPTLPERGARDSCSKRFRVWRKPTPRWGRPLNDFVVNPNTVRYRCAAFENGPDDLSRAQGMFSNDVWALREASARLI